MKKWFAALIKAIQEGQQKRADYWLLQNMSDKDLHDIGIGRGDIHRVVYGEEDAKAEEYCERSRELYQAHYAEKLV